jgi:polar amino acid transport system substrate-binding protein
MHTTKRLWGLGLIAVLAAACSTTGGGATVSPSIGSEAPATEAPSPSAPASQAPASAAAEGCDTESLELVEPGTLTIGTDNPAYPPYFEFSDSPTPPWELGDPTTGGGFEGAFAYALAEELGFSRDEVAWTVVPFANSFAPGPKAFDLDINQVSYSPERAENVDLSDGYYFVNQSVVARKDTPVAAAKTLTELKAYRFGAQVGTTSLETIQSRIAPTTEPSVYDTNDAALAALNAGQIDAIVVDLPTAFFMTAAQMEDGVIVGQIEGSSDADAEYFSVVLPKDSPLTDCVNQAIATLQDDGRLDAITQEWLSDKAAAPVLQP